MLIVYSSSPQYYFQCVCADNFQGLETSKFVTVAIVICWSPNLDKLLFLADADAWQFWGKMKPIFCFFWLYLPPSPKTEAPLRGLIFIDATNKFSI